MMQLKNIMNKKGQGEKTIFYIGFAFIFMGILMTLFYVFARETTDEYFIANGLEDFVFAQRFLNNPSCFTYQDIDTLRTYPGIIDTGKFTKENLEKCYSSDKKGFMLTLKHNKEDIIKTDNFENPEKADTYYVLVYENGKFMKGEMYVQVQNFRS